MSSRTWVRLGAFVVYDAPIAALHRYGGSVVGFGGDAVTCWLDANSVTDRAGLRATACALAMQEAMGRFSEVRAPAGMPIPLGVKVAVVFGPAREHSQQALAIAREVGDRSTEGDALTRLGHALAGLGQPDEAAGAYREGLAVRRELGAESLATETLAGLARVALAWRALGEAQARVDAIPGYLEHNAPDGSCEPLRVCLTCWRVLAAGGGPRPAAGARRRDRGRGAAALVP